MRSSFNNHDRFIMHHQMPLVNPNRRPLNAKSFRLPAINGSVETGAKNYPCIDKNQAFKYIRDHLATSHMERSNKPNFNIAGIAPIQPSDEQQNPKTPSENSNEANIIINNYMNGFKVSRKNTQANNAMESLKRELVYKSQQTGGEHEDEHTRYASRLKLPDIEISNRNHRLSNLSHYLYKTNSSKLDVSLSNSESSRDSRQNKKKKSQIIGEESNNNNNISTSTDYTEVKMNKTIASILPKSLAANDHRPSFCCNYKQSGARLEQLEQVKYSNSLKINASAPKIWLKSKFLSNGKLHNQNMLVLY